MYETQLVRHTTMIVGPTGGGKSLVLETLKNARLTAENIVVKMYVLNPKAQPLNELYGEMDPVTRDWTDGILSKLFRELNDRLPGTFMLIIIIFAIYRSFLSCLSMYIENRFYNIPQCIMFKQTSSLSLVGKENEIRWIVFDGDVDALWVENMNSVMDDNRLLTLPNGNIYM
jgi:dynein heavy chain